MSNEYPLKSLVENEWLDWAWYTVEKRAMASMIDGLKPSQRFYLYSSIVNSKNDFKKVAAICGVVSEYGYNHGENSVGDAGQNMAAEWKNNLNLIQPRGNFGTRVNTDRAAIRYTYTKLHENFKKYVKDLDLSPQYADPEILIPKFYIPIIPLIAVNGTSGMAPGFASNILPRDTKDIIKAVEKVVNGTKLRSNTIKPKMPMCESTFEYKDGRWIESCINKIKRPSKTKLIIEELPYGVTREKYVEFLYELKDRGAIVSFVDDTQEEFKFDVKLKSYYTPDPEKNPDEVIELPTLSDEEICDLFSLVTTHSENINALDEHGKLVSFDSIEELIMAFVEFRMPYMQARIDTELVKAIEIARYDAVVVEFIEAVLANKVRFKGKTARKVKDMILDVTSATEEDTDRLIRMNIVSLTKEKAQELKDKAKESEELIEYWRKTDPMKQYIEDINSLA